MSYLVYDCETTITKSFNRTANPLDPRNYVVAYGFRYSEEKDTEVRLEYFSERTDLFDKLAYYLHYAQPELLIGHNIKFDLLYLWKYEFFQNWLKKGGRIWDTMLAEYLISGQQISLKRAGTCGLRILAEKAGAPAREKLMEIYWQEGRCTSTIPKTVILEDLESDVKDTEVLYLEQVSRIDPGAITVYQAYMDSLLATIEMEFNGMRVDKDLGLRDREYIQFQLKEIDSELFERSNFPERIQFNPASNDHISCVLFGGSLYNIEPIPVLQEGDPIIYKSGIKRGQVKTKLTKLEYRVDGLGAKTKEKKETKKGGYFSVSDEVLQSLLVNNKKAVKEFAELVIKRRELATLLDRYYTSMLECITPWTNCIHTEFQHNLTETGRLSSRNPNLQNIPRG
jgi:DNA polymerase I-like protein with 3'-5' exonuclease and polymerase domains